MVRRSWLSSRRLMQGGCATLALLLVFPLSSEAGLFGRKRSRNPEAVVVAPAQVLGIVVEPLPDGLRLQIDCSSRVRFRWGLLENPRSFYVDLDGAQIAQTLRTLSIGAAGVAEISSESRGPEQVRICLGLREGVRPRVDTSDDGRSLTIRIKSPEPIEPAAGRLPSVTPGQAQAQRLPRDPASPPAVSPTRPSTPTCAVTTIEGENLSGVEAVVRVRARGAVASWKSFRLENPPRLVVDLEGAEHLVTQAPRVLGPGLLLPGSIRSSQFSQDPPVTRVVIRLPAASTPATVDPPDAAGELRVRIGTRSGLSTAPLPPVGTVRLAKSLHVGIDPGHGGSDPGALNPAVGVCEKEITLDIARRLALILEQSGIRSSMTRRDDRRLEQSERIEFVARGSADVFVSIHCDAIEKRPEWTGITTYYHGQRASSRALAVALQSVLPAAIGLPDRGVRSDTTRFRGGFYILRNARMPAVLIECGYVSHTATARSMQRPEFRQQVAQGIADGLRKYWKEEAPHTISAALPR